jgi:hypothetical protein
MSVCKNAQECETKTGEIFDEKFQIINLVRLFR